ncbi:MAG: glycosyltransferase [Verrucomicrobia bacterium]|nr:glycosyltransferase [Verrucomicrobiota bacterium]
MVENIFESRTALPRIAMVSTHGYVASNPPLGAADTGGQVVYVLELSKKLAQLGYEVDIWTRRFEGQEEIDVVNDQVRIIRMACGGPDFISKEYLYEKLPEWGENALRFIKKHELKYQFINSHYWDAGLAGQHLSEVLGVPHIHTPHSLGVWKLRQMEADFPDSKETFDKQYNFSKRIHHERLLYGQSDMVIATTPQQLDLLSQDYEVPPEHCRMIPPGYDDNRFFPVGEASRAAIRQRLGFSGKVVLAIGRLARNKGYDLLINGFKVLLEREPEAVLYLGVGGVNLNELESRILAELKQQVAELELSDKVTFAGFVPEDDMPDYYRAADVFVLSSRYEPFGMTAIEAMASGTPTVVTTHGGLFRSVTFGRHALYADTFDKEDLGIMMLKPLRHPRLRMRLARMGAHKARSLFTWTGIAQQLIAVVERRDTSTFVVSDTEWDEPWNDAD